MSSTSSTRDIHDWNRIAGAYAGASADDDFINRQFKTVLWECLGEVGDLNVLDLGCGAGWLCAQLQERGARVVGVDGSVELIERARAEVPGVEFVVHDLAQGLPPQEQSFERIVANMVLMDIPDLSQLMRDVRASFKPGGKLIFTMQHPCFFNIKSHRDEEGHLFKKLTGYLQPEVWRMESFGGHNHYHRSLTFYFDLLHKNDLAVTRFYEPPHQSATQRPDADAHFFENIPIFLLIEATAPSGSST